MSNSTTDKTGLPPFKRHKAKGRPDRAYTVIDGRRRYLGNWEDPASRERYDQLVAEWLSAGRRLQADADQLTVVELVDQFMVHARAYYRKPDGTPTNEADNFRIALRPLLSLYGRSPAAEFGPKALRAVREQMIAKGWSRPYINTSVKRIRAAFRWAVSFELVPPNALHGLQAVEPLKHGRCIAPEPEPVTPVDDRVVAATLSCLPPSIQAMVKLQQLTGMRPGEVCALTTGMIDTSGDIWIATFTWHKTAYRGRRRLVWFGPQAQDVLRPWLEPELAAPHFTPAMAIQERGEAKRAQRKTPLSCGNRFGSNRCPAPRRGPGNSWTTQAYGKAIVQAVDMAFPPPPALQRKRVPARGRKKNAMRWETPTEWKTRLGLENWTKLQKWQRDHRWTPNQLRHSYATRVRREHGLEAAQVLLGHAKADVTQVYAERDVQKALSVAREVG